MATGKVRVFGTQYVRRTAEFWQHGTTTISIFYKWFRAFTLIPAQYWALYPTYSGTNRCGKPAGPALQRDSADIVTPGDYVVLDGVNIGTHWDQHEDFISKVRRRDMRCCLTGKEVTQNTPNFAHFKVARIFPLSAKNEFYRLFSHCIKDPDVDKSTKINSVQQGFLVCIDWYNSFTTYTVGINPDDDYRITDFSDCLTPSPQAVDGRTFYINPTVPVHHHPCPELLRDHSRRCILLNVRVLPYHDIFPPDTDSDDSDSDY